MLDEPGVCVVAARVRPANCTADGGARLRTAREEQDQGSAGFRRLAGQGGKDGVRPVTPVEPRELHALFFRISKPRWVWDWARDPVMLGAGEFEPRVWGPVPGRGEIKQETD